MIRFVDRFRDLASDFDIVLSDVWGVIHNGIAAFPEACEALRMFRERGGTVAMITNAPRPSAPVVDYLRGLKIGDDTYDAIVSSGDVTLHYIDQHRHMKPYYLGPRRDRGIYDALNLSFVPIESADYIVDVGLVHEDTEHPDDYRAMLEKAASRRLPMICANPDLVVERGDRLVYCAGALAELYRNLGGEVIFAGKPHRPIYEQALGAALDKRKQAGKSVASPRVLAIGDSVRTDLEGANAFGIPCLFVISLIHAADFGGHDDLDEARLGQFFGQASKPPIAVTRRLAW
jgi:HAD superfamily hydrolase (TIGR01459 family)